MGKTILEHTLLSLKKAEITDIILVVSPNSPVEQIIGDGKRWGMHITYVVQQDALGMGHALLQSEQYIKNDFFLLNAYHFEADQFIHDMIKKKKKKEEVVLLGKRTLGAQRYGYMSIAGGKIIGIVEKPKEAIADTLHIIGIYLLNKQFFPTLRETPLSHYHFEEALAIYAKGEQVTFLETDKKTITLKYAWDVLDVKEYLLENIKSSISSKAEISQHAIISGDVIIEEGVKIFEGACIKGPCYIGRNVVVGNNALDQWRDRGRNAVIGSYMEMRNSIIMEGSTTHSGFIGDSVIGQNTKIGAAMCTTNVRLDREIFFRELKERE